MTRKRPVSQASDVATGGSTSRSLLSKLRAEEPLAWQRLVDLYAPLVGFWCRKLDVPPQDVEDVTQDVFRAVASNIGTFRRDRPGDTFRGWLRTITRSKVMDYYRARANEPSAAGGTAAQRWLAEQPDDEPCPPEADEDEKAVRDAIFQRAMELIKGEFRERTWTVFWRVVIDGVPPKEVAEELSMKPGAVRVAKCRVLRRLREELGESP